MCHTHWDHVEWLRPDDIFQLLRSSSQMLSSWEFNWNFNSNMNVGECERRGCQARRVDLVYQRWIRLVWILDHFGIFSIKWPGISWWCFTSQATTSHMLVLCWGVECRKHGHVCSHILSAHQFNAPGLQRNRVTELKQRIKLFGFRNISEPFTLIQLCRNLQPEQELWGNCSLPSPAARYAILFSVEMFIRICAVGPVAYFCSTGLVKPPRTYFRMCFSL